MPLPLSQHMLEGGQMIEADDRMRETGKKALQEGLRSAACHGMMRLRRHCSSKSQNRHERRHATQVARTSMQADHHTIRSCY